MTKKQEKNNLSLNVLLLYYFLKLELKYLMVIFFLIFKFILSNKYYIMFIICIPYFIIITYYTMSVASYYNDVYNKMNGNVA
jgi:hypothetical protein